MLIGVEEAALIQNLNVPVDLIERQRLVTLHYNYQTVATLP